MIYTIGAGVGGFLPEDANYDKTFIKTDVDTDELHIQDLCFIIFLPHDGQSIVEAGYIAFPPLQDVKRKKRRSGLC